MEAIHIKAAKDPLHRSPRRVLRGAANATELLKRYRRLIDRAARKMAGRAGSSQLIDELWSAGALGLLEAANRFDAKRDAKFESFAEHRIRGAMLDELRRIDHLPRRLRARAKRVTKFRRTLGHQLGRDCTSEELAQRLGLSITELDRLEQLAQPLVPLTSEILKSLPELAPDQTLEREELLARLTAAIAALSERLQTVLSLHYVEELTYREIAQILRVSEPRICQLHGDALRRLRAILSAQEAKTKAQLAAVRRRTAARYKG